MIGGLLRLIGRLRRPSPPDPPGRVVLRHQLWCGMQFGRRCTCRPDVIVKPEHPRDFKRKES